MSALEAARADQRKISDRYSPKSNEMMFSSRGDSWVADYRRDNPPTGDPEFDSAFTRLERPDGKGSIYAPSRKSADRLSRDHRKVKVTNALINMRKVLRENEK